MPGTQAIARLHRIMETGVQRARLTWTGEGNVRKETVTLNGITYKWPSKPVVVVCIDGCDPTYIEQGIKDGIIPTQVSPGHYRSLQLRSGAFCLR